MCYIKKCLLAFAALSLLFSCTPENNGGDNQSGNEEDNTLVHVAGISLDRNSATIKEGDYTYTIPTPVANGFYKLEIVCAKAFANGGIQISKLSYNK